MNMSVGGDPERYMDPPLIPMSKGGPSFIASLLDMVGIGRQVAKGPKEGGEEGKAESELIQPEMLATPPNAKGAREPAILGEVESVMGGQEDPSDFGKRWLESLKPIKKIDL